MGYTLVRKKETKKGEIAETNIGYYSDISLAVCAVVRQLLRAEVEECTITTLKAFVERNKALNEELKRMVKA